MRRGKVVVVLAADLAAEVSVAARVMVRVKVRVRVRVKVGLGPTPTPTPNQVSVVGGQPLAKLLVTYRKPTDMEVEKHCP